MADLLIPDLLTLIPKTDFFCQILYIFNFSLTNAKPHKSTASHFILRFRSAGESDTLNEITTLVNNIGFVKKLYENEPSFKPKRAKEKFNFCFSSHF